MKPYLALTIVVVAAAVLLPACGLERLTVSSQTTPTSEGPSEQLAATAVLKPLPSPIPPESLDPNPLPRLQTTTAAIAPTATRAAPGTWQTYRSERGGYRVEHPAGWTVNEQVGTDGSIATAFAAPDRSAIISVLVESGEFAEAGSSDVPNTRCQPVMVGGLSGMRCFDTLNFATSTTVSANGKTFTIAALGKRVDESIYNRFLQTFQVT